MSEKSLTDYLRHPLSLATMVVSVVASLVQIPLATEFGTWLLTSSGSLFTGASIFAFTVLPEVDPELAELAKPVALVLGVIYGISKLYRAGKNLSKTVEE